MAREMENVTVGEVQESAPPESIKNAAYVGGSPKALQTAPACSVEDNISESPSESLAVCGVESPVTLTEFTLFPKLPPELRLMVVRIPFINFLSCTY